jgi:hypothetical protein
MLNLEKYVEEINDKCILCNKTLKSILILSYPCQLFKINQRPN